jgi:hypothetical protein
VSAVIGSFSQNLSDLLWNTGQKLWQQRLDRTSIRLRESQWNHNEMGRVVGVNANGCFWKFGICCRIEVVILLIPQVSTVKWHKN